MGLLYLRKRVIILNRYLGLPFSLMPIPINFVFFLFLPFNHLQILILIQLEHKHLQNNIPRGPGIHNLPSAVNRRRLNGNQFINDVFHSENVHLLCIPIEDAVFEQELVQSHKVVCALTAFGSLAIEYDDFF